MLEGARRKEVLSIRLLKVVLSIRLLVKKMIKLKKKKKLIGRILTFSVLF